MLSNRNKGCAFVRLLHKGHFVICASDKSRIVSDISIGKGKLNLIFFRITFEKLVYFFERIFRTELNDL